MLTSPRPPSAKSRSNGASPGSSVTPVAVEHACVRVVRPAARRPRRRALRRARPSGTARPGESPARIHAEPTPQPVPISATRVRPRCDGEHVQQPARLLAARPLEAEPLSQREGSLDERRHHVPTLQPVPEPLPLPPHFDAGRVGEVWRVDYAARFEDAAPLARAARADGRCARPLPCRARRRGRPEHVLHARLRALRRRPLRDGRARRLAPPVRVRLPESRRRSRRSSRRSTPTMRCRSSIRSLLVDEEGRHPAPFTLVSAEDVAEGRWRVDPAAAEGLGLDVDIRAGAPPLLHRGAGAGRQVQPHHLAVPRAARRHRLRARLGRRGGDLLPHDRAARAGRVPAEGRQPAHRALLDARARGRGRPRGRAARPRATSRSSRSCCASTRS